MATTVQTSAAASSARPSGKAVARSGVVGAAMSLQDTLACVGMTLMAPVVLLVVMVLSLYQSFLTWVRTEMMWS